MPFKSSKWYPVLENTGDIEAEIQISIDKDKKTLSITDNGIGMTAEEVKNTLTRSPSPVLGIHSEIPRQIRSTDVAILASALLLIHGGAKVEIDTLSYKEGSQAVHWSCDGSPEFRLEDSSRKERGTTVTLTLQEEQRYLNRCASASW